MKFLKFAGALWSGFLDYWKWAAAIAGVAVLIASHVAAYKLGHRMAEADEMETKLAEQGDQISGLTKAIGDAAVNGAALEKLLGGLRRDAFAARQEIQNVLPPPETDHACDYPAAARGLQNRASGYTGSADLVGADGGGRATPRVQGR